MAGTWRFNYSYTCNLVYTCLFINIWFIFRPILEFPCICWYSSFSMKRPLKYFFKIVLVLDFVWRQRKHLFSFCLTSANDNQYTGRTVMSVHEEHVLEPNIKPLKYFSVCTITVIFCLVIPARKNSLIPSQDLFAQVLWMPHSLR